MPVMTMKRKIFGAAVGIFVAALFLLPCAKAAEPPSVSAKSAILYDCTASRVLYEKDADRQSLIASTTKIMTGLLVCERCQMDDAVQIPDQAVGVEGSSLYLKQGETLCVEDLLYGLMLQSGNDAAVALAIHCGGSVEEFVVLMNQKAAELQLTNTHFANPNGLDDEQNYSTAHDLAVLSQYALVNPIFAQTVATKTATLGGNRSVANHNKLLWRYDGCIGVKTGFTRAAGRILVSAAERDGRRLVAVTIGAPDDWNDHTKLLDYGFSLTLNGPE